MKKHFIVALSATFFSLGATGSIPAKGAPQADPLADLKAEKLKIIIRREPKIADTFEKVQAKIPDLLTDPRTKPYGQRLERELAAINMYSSSGAEWRVKDDADLLNGAVKNFAPPSAEELKPLQERYAKLIQDLDDHVLVKDYDRLLKRHDKFIRHTALGLWDKQKISDELQAMEEMAANAPDIAFGKAEALRGMQDRRLAAVPKLTYVGLASSETEFLSPARRSVGILEESLAGTIPIESAEIVVGGADGNFVNLSSPNSSARDLPFSPPLSLWMKTRMLEGRVPAITFALPPNMAAQDVLDGKLDDYFKTNFKEIADTKQAAIVGIFAAFDQQMAANSFGSDGRTPFYRLDPKLSKLSEEDARSEFLKASRKGTYASSKSVFPELSSGYGDPNIPDGPERVRDAFKHVRALAGNTPQLAFYTSAGAFHGSKFAAKTAGYEQAGTQAWNKLDYYYPGDGVFDWIGVRAVGTDPQTDTKGANLNEAIGEFLNESGSSAWKNTQVTLMALAPGETPNPVSEASWIATVFPKVMNAEYPRVSIVLVDLPDGLTLWTRESAAAYKSHVTGNKAFKWPLRFKMLQ